MRRNLGIYDPPRVTLLVDLAREPCDVHAKGRAKSTCIGSPGWSHTHSVADRRVRDDITFGDDDRSAFSRDELAYARDPHRRHTSIGSLSPIANETAHRGGPLEDAA